MVNRIKYFAIAGLASVLIIASSASSFADSVSMDSLADVEQAVTSGLKKCSELTGKACDAPGTETACLPEVNRGLLKCVFCTDKKEYSGEMSCGDRFQAIPVL